jgi:hypothetical protein
VQQPCSNPSATSGTDVVFGGNGDDTAYGGDGPDTIGGESGQDTLNGGGGADTLVGGKSDDSSTSESPNQDTINGGNGPDQIQGGFGVDTIIASYGDDEVRDGSYQDGVTDNILGGPDNDTIESFNFTAVADQVDCGGGTDRVIADHLDVVSDDCERVRIVNLTAEERAQIEQQHQEMKSEVKRRTEEHQATLGQASVQSVAEPEQTMVTAAQAIEELEKSGAVSEQVKREFERAGRVARVPLYSVGSPEQGTLNIHSTYERRSGGGSVSTQQQVTIDCGVAFYTLYNMGQLYGSGTVAITITDLSYGPLTYWVYAASVYDESESNYFFGGGPITGTTYRAEDIFYFSVDDPGLYNGWAGIAARTTNGACLGVPTDQVQMG